MGLQAVAGAALGVLLGLLIGLSNSPVVAVVVGALASGLMVLLGFVPNKVADAGAAGVDAPRATAWRLAGFGFACAAALLAGMYIRTHEAMSPSPQAQMKRLTDAGFSVEEAHAWVAFKDAGLLFKTSGGTAAGGAANGGTASGGTAVTATVVDKDHSGANSGSSFLLAQNGVNNCRMFTEENYPSSDEELKALAAAGDPFKAMADALRPLDAAKRAAALKVLRTVYCK